MAAEWKKSKHWSRISFAASAGAIKLFQESDVRIYGAGCSLWSFRGKTGVVLLEDTIPDVADWCRR